MSEQQPPRDEDEREHEHAGGPWHDGASDQTKPVWQDAEDMETAERAPADEPDQSGG
jgi:hypothetical protein